MFQQQALMNAAQYAPVQLTNAVSNGSPVTPTTVNSVSGQQGGQGGVTPAGSVLSPASFANSNQSGANHNGAVTDLLQQYGHQLEAVNNLQSYMPGAQYASIAAYPAASYLAQAILPTAPHPHLGNQPGTTSGPTAQKEGNHFRFVRLELNTHLN